MSKIKIIPCLDIKDGRVIKNEKFLLNSRDAGDPAELASFYCKEGADALAMLDTTASLEKRGTLLETVKRVSAQISVPFIVGGGIRTVSDADEVLAAGASMVLVNTAAIRRPELISELAKQYGSGRVVVAIDAKRDADGKYRLCINGGREILSETDAVEWAVECEKRGAGEIVLTGFDTDGTKNGYDLEMTKSVAEAIKIPVTASGGAGILEHFYEAVAIGKASNVLAASLFHFKELSIMQVKNYLHGKGLDVFI
ncbi:MAG: imidazole glycerol phosphate synthase subunit HisF [Defluviitaleaceae bacterium]|nr:imidazole glycerol phosphate synthase subunit HisF [Defluviitaleaceae bacterium]